ncbi:MAG: AAA family ATPase [Clostridia bacterium]|jgi:hypothetical protein|nr:AAA family ATPase [Clostridia bacterium]
MAKVQETKGNISYELIRNKFWDKFEGFLKTDIIKSNNAKIMRRLDGQLYLEISDYNEYASEIGFKCLCPPFKSEIKRLSIGFYIKRTSELFKLRKMNYRYFIKYLNERADSDLSITNPYSQQNDGDWGWVSVDHKIENFNDESNWTVFFEWFKDAYLSLNKVLKDIKNKVIDLNSLKEIPEPKNKSLLPEANDKNLTKSNYKKAENIILYGVPGSGKSYTIKSKIYNLFQIKKESVYEIDYENEISERYKQLEVKGQVRRIVFHPDYTYSDFVGQILPQSDNGRVDYQFKPGPFTRILAEALSTIEDEPHFLIIEEVNRGNAAAIFGDIFQLLDRDENGKSEYSIENKDIIDEINRVIENKNIQNNDNEIKLLSSVYLPSNLWIIATMNTSDQNVFTLDTAFQRRWNMELIPNDLENKNPKLDFIIEGLGIKWLSFAKKINNKITENNSMLASGDKRLGAWFICADKNKELVSKHVFANKVLKYLWDDAFKFNREDIFSENYNTLEEVIREFVNGKSEIIFNEKIKTELHFNEKIASEETTEEN